jgi:hypothetical protein
MAIDKLLATISFVFIAFASGIIAFTAPATGYELSIYDAYPLYFWFFLIGSIACGVLILVHQAFSEQRSQWWLAGFLAIIFCNMVIVSLPLFRGYAVYGRADTLSHLGVMKDILLTGHVDNYYPLVHNLGAIISNVTGLAQGGVLYVLLPVFSVIFVLNVYLLATAIASQRGQVLLIVAFASPLIFSYYHVHIHPFVISMYMVLLLLYFFHQRGKLLAHKVENMIALLLVAFFITFAHPHIAFMVIKMMLVFGLSKVILRLLLKYKKAISLEPAKISRYFSMAGIMFAIFWIWYMSFPGFERNFTMVLDWMLYGKGTIAATEIVMALEAKGLSLFQTIYLFIIKYGAIFIYFLTSLAAVVLILWQTIFKRHKLSVMNLTYALQLIAALSVATFSLFAHTALMQFPVRIASFPLLLSVVISGLLIYNISRNGFSERDHEKGSASVRSVFIGVTALIIITSSTISIFNVYMSPITFEVNVQVTKMEITGMSWFIHHRDHNILLATSARFGVLRFEHLIGGVAQSGEKRIKKDPVPIPFQCEDHLHKSIGESFDSPGRYMIITKLDRVTPMAYTENARRHIAELRSDSTAAQIYSNGEFEVWRIYGKYHPKTEQEKNLQQALRIHPSR